MGYPWEKRLYSLEEYAHVFYPSQYWNISLNDRAGFHRWNLDNTDMPEFFSFLYRIKYNEYVLKNIEKQLSTNSMEPHKALELLEGILTDSDKVLYGSLAKKLVLAMQSLFSVYVKYGFDDECRLRFVYLCSLAEKSKWISATEQESCRTSREFVQNCTCYRLYFLSN